MADVTITISLKPGTANLFLSDSNGNSGPPTGFVTQVERGDTVYWKLDPLSSIEAITGITAKRGSFTIFNPNQPKPERDGSWCGKIKDDAAGNDSYNIEYRVGGRSFTEDPDVETKPPKP